MQIWEAHFQKKRLNPFFSIARKSTFLLKFNNNIELDYRVFVEIKLIFQVYFSKECGRLCHEVDTRNNSYMQLPNFLQMYFVPFGNELLIF